MAKKTNNPIKQRPAQAVPQKKEEAMATVAGVKDPLIPAWLYEFKVQAIIVALLAFAFYCNTFQHEYALDDTIVIVKNEYVHEGFEGIPAILTKDAFDSYYRQFNSSNQLSGGRYRPLSILTFAIEQQFFGAVPKEKVDSVLERGLSYDMKSKEEQHFLSNMHARHVFNVFWYIGCVVSLLYFLRYVVFRDNHIMALIAAVLFTVHPIHTEVVANVKSRDEIMSLLLLCVTYIYAFRYRESDKKSHLYFSMVSLFLAFLAKEYAISMIILMPLAFYIFNGYDISKSLKATLPYFAVIAVYLVMRKAIVAPMNASSDNDILNNPYANADDVEKLATKISTSFNYIKLLVWPNPLSSDYSYNTIPYKTFSHWSVWASLIFHGVLFRYLFYYFKKRSVMCFAIAFYLFNLLLVCNIIFNIGGTMGERLIFHSSVGFSIAVAFFLYKGMEKIKPAATGRMALAAFMVVVVALCGFKTVERNADWKNDETLFAHDIENAPNSVLVNANVASSYVNKSESEKDTVKKREMLRTGIRYYNKALEVHPTFVSGYMNRGVAYLKLDMPDSAKANYDRAKELYPNYPKLYEVYYNLGVCYFLSGKIREAISIWQMVIKMDPTYVLAQQSINTAIQALNAPPQPQQQPDQGQVPQAGNPPPGNQ
jgi:protein O-mannosyl-transferase